MLKVPPKMLMLVASIVWLAAGAGVVSVGISASPSPWTVFMGIACLIVYLLFLIMFLMISRKHIRRIRDYTEEFVSIFQFFDARSYIIMAVMIGLGAAVRLSELVPGFIIAFFYSGLGLALITSGIYYVVSYIALCDELKAPPNDGTK
jgi:hypothetical protein